MPRRPTPLPMPMLNRRRLLGGSLAVAAVVGSHPRLLNAQAREVNVFNWDTYIGPDTVDDFTEATGIDVRYDLFGSSDELFGRLREGNPGYDVIYPSNDYVERMIVADMLVPLDHSRIPNMANLDPNFTDPRFDPGRQFSMPYFWGTIGIGYRKTVAQPTSWSAVFESDEHAGRISMLNDKNTLQAALRYLGYSLNTENPDEINEAAELLIRQKPNIKTFGPDNGQDLLIAGEVDLCLEWNGDILQVMEEDDELSYVVPSEGTLQWEDDMAIPKGGPNPDEALEWINFILDAEVHGAIATYIKYPLPNKAAKAFIPEEDLNNPAIYPPEDGDAEARGLGLQGRGDRDALRAGADPGARRLTAAWRAAGGLTPNGDGVRPRRDLGAAGRSGSGRFREPRRPVPRRSPARIAERLRADGLAADTLDLAQAPSVPEILDGTALVVVVAAVRYGRHLEPAERFLEAYRQAAGCPAARLGVGQPDRAQAREADGRDQSLHQEADREARAAAGRGRPCSPVGLDYPSYGWLDRQMIRLIMWLTGGPTDGTSTVDYTSWPRVDAFADDIAAVVRSKAA